MTASGGFRGDVPAAVLMGEQEEGEEARRRKPLAGRPEHPRQQLPGGGGTVDGSVVRPDATRIIVEFWPLLGIANSKTGEESTQP